MKSLKNKIDAFFDDRKYSAATVTALIISAVMVLNVMLCYLTQAFGLYFYRAEYTEDFTISGMTDDMFEDAIDRGEKVRITFLMERESLDTHATGGFVLDTVEQFKQRYEKSDFITLRFVNTLTKLDQDGERVDLEKYKKDMRGNDVTLGRTAVIFESSDGSYRVLSNVQGGVGFVDFYTFDSMGNVVSFNGETIIASMIMWVLADEHKTAYITANHAEENDANFATMLAASGYYISSINLQDVDVPDDAAMVVISNPKHDFERAAADSDITTEIKRLEKYVNEGGNLYVSLDPYVKRLNNLESFIERFGIGLRSGQTDSGELRYLVRDPNRAITIDGYTILADIAEGGIADSISSTVARYADGGIILRDAAALNLSGNAKPVLVTSGGSECTLGGEVADTDGGYTIAAHSTHTHTTDDGVSTTANIFVISSIYLCSSDAVTSNSYSNRDFIYSLFDHAFGAENPPYGANSVTYYADDLKNLTMGEAKLYTALLLSIPAIIAVVGVIVTIRRKNR